jgi:PII-like signaling protein
MVFFRLTTSSSAWARSGSEAHSAADASSYEVIVLKAREAQLAGATVARGAMGFGRSSRLHTAKRLRLSFDLPIVIEIVDTESKIQEFLPTLESMMTSEVITLEKVQGLQYGTPQSRQQHLGHRRPCAPFGNRPSAF